MLVVYALQVSDFYAIDIAKLFCAFQEGRAALESINKTMGLAFDEFDLEVRPHNIHSPAP